jgi:DNA anti-recombination protein RmuC
LISGDDALAHGERGCTPPTKEAERMALKQDMARQIEQQMQVWQAQIQEHQERLAQAGSQAKADYEKGLGQLRANAEEAGKLLNQVRETNEAAWKDMQQASLQSLERLQKGWADALQRFT